MRGKVGIELNLREALLEAPSCREGTKGVETSLMERRSAGVSGLAETMPHSRRREANSPTVALINAMHPPIRGWSQYCCTGVASEVFTDLDHGMDARAQRSMQRRHPRPSGWWRSQKSWGRTMGARRDRWVFQDQQRHAALRNFAWTRIVRHRLVPKTYAPDDPTLQDDWRPRSTRPRATTERHGRLAQRQQGLCPGCHQALDNGEGLHIHHGVPQPQGGTDDLANLWRVHPTCHRQLHSYRAVSSRVVTAMVGPLDLGGRHPLLL
jgi:RNA-directed DNA polymerase